MTVYASDITVHARNIPYHLSVYWSHVKTPVSITMTIYFRLLLVIPIPVDQGTIFSVSSYGLWIRTHYHGDTVKHIF